MFPSISVGATHQKDRKVPSNPNVLLPPSPTKPTTSASGLAPNHSALSMRNSESFFNRSADSRNALTISGFRGSSGSTPPSPSSLPSSSSAQKGKVVMFVSEKNPFATSQHGCIAHSSPLDVRSQQPPAWSIASKWTCRFAQLHRHPRTTLAIPFEDYL